MSERVLTDERPVDEDITTASLAGLDERSPLRDKKDIEQSDEVRRNAEADTQRRDLNITETNTTNRTAIELPATTPSAQKSAAAEEQSAPMFPGAEATDLHTRWDAIQVGFVDEPRQAVQQADALVAGAMKRLAEIFAEERARLEAQWGRGDSVSTEDLRLALRRYRSFFGRVLSV